MSVSAPESPFRIFRRLWRRAPAWRVLGLLAASLTLLCVLFPPRSFVTGSTRTVEPQAAYTPQARPATAPGPIPITAPAQPPVQKTTPATHANPPAVQTAALSLATPDNQTHSLKELDSAFAGHPARGSLRVDGFNVPLPPGEWLQLANMHFSQKDMAGEMLMLGQVKNRRLMGYVRITAARSTAEPGKGFPGAPGCERRNASTNVLVNDGIEPFGHQACWLMEHSFLAPLEAWADRAKKLPALERAAAGDLAAKGVSYPQEMMSVRFTRAENWGLLEVRYAFNPEEEHITSGDVAGYTDSDWQPATIDRYPEKVAYVDKLRLWAANFWPKVKAAFDAGTPEASR